MFRSRFPTLRRRRAKGAAMTPANPKPRRTRRSRIRSRFPSRSRRSRSPTLASSRGELARAIAVATRRDDRTRSHHENSLFARFVFSIVPTVCARRVPRKPAPSVRRRSAESFFRTSPEVPRAPEHGRASSQGDAIRPTPATVPQDAGTPDSALAAATPPERREPRAKRDPSGRVVFSFARRWVFARTGNARARGCRSVRPSRRTKRRLRRRPRGRDREAAATLLPAAPAPAESALRRHLESRKPGLTARANALRADRHWHIIFSRCRDVTAPGRVDACGDRISSMSAFAEDKESDYGTVKKVRFARERVQDPQRSLRGRHSRQSASDP